MRRRTIGASPVAEQGEGSLTGLAALQAVAESSDVTARQRALQRMADQRPNANTPVQQSDRGGLPDPLKSGVESLSGVSMDGVSVHRNSPAPAQIGAAAFAQGRDIHLGPGQEQHLPHEAWHVVQQAQGRVRPTTQLMGAEVNYDTALEAEADEMGARALSQDPHERPADADLQPPNSDGAAPIQGRFGFEIEVPIFYTTDGGAGDGRRYDPGNAVLDQGLFEVKVDHNEELRALQEYANVHSNGNQQGFANGPSIMELVTKPIDEFDSSVNEVFVQALGDHMAQWTRDAHALAVAGDRNLEGDFYVGSDSPRRNLQTTLGYFQTTYAIKLSQVPDMFKATAKSAQKTNAEDAAAIAQLKAAAKAGPAIAKALRRAQTDDDRALRSITVADPTGEEVPLVTDADFNTVGGYGALLVNYLIADPLLATGGGLGKNKIGDYFYKSDLGAVAQTLPAGILNLLQNDDAVLGTFVDALCEASSRARDDDLVIGMTLEDWVDRIIAGGQDVYLQALKNPNSAVLAPEDIGPVNDRETSAIMENRAPENLDPRSKAKRKQKARELQAFYSEKGWTGEDLQDRLSTLTDPKKYPPEQWGSVMVMIYKLLRKING